MRPKLRAISDTSFLSAMHQIGYLEACEGVFEQLYVSKSVWDEVGRGEIAPLTALLGEMIGKEFVVLKACGNAPLANSLRTFLGSGEAETIALALELKEAELVMLDDLKARRLFRRLGIERRLVGTIGILKSMILLGHREGNGQRGCGQAGVCGISLQERAVWGLLIDRPRIARRVVSRTPSRSSAISEVGCWGWLRQRGTERWRRSYGNLA